MKNIAKIRSISERKGSFNLFILFAVCLTMGITSCSKEELEPDLRQNAADDLLMLNATSKTASSGAVIEEIGFAAIAMISKCHGENIAFSGIIQNRVSKTTDANGQVHYSRSFRTRGLTGTGMTTGTEYDVIGGAEMFAIKNPVFNAQGMLDIAGSLAESDILIHQGTLVFQSRTDGSRVVARHIIRKVPGKDDYVSKWECGGK